MAYEQKPGELVIFKNDKKTTDNQPDYKGRGLDLQGQPVEIALWVKQGRDQKFFSARIEYPRQAQQPAQPQAAQQPQRYAQNTPGHPQEDRDLPF